MIVQPVPVSVCVPSVIMEISASPRVWSIVSDLATNQLVCVTTPVLSDDTVIIVPFCVRKLALEPRTDVFDLQGTAS